MKLSIDPGIRHCGAAQFFPSGELAGAWLAKNPRKSGGTVREVVTMTTAVFQSLLSGIVETVVIERMQIRFNSPGDPNKSLLPLHGVACAVAALFPRAEHVEYLPHDWKGSYDGIECTRRVRERLTPEEFSRIDLPPGACAECRKHFGLYCLKGSGGCGADHVFDAIGIGLKHSGRFERKRVFPR